MTYFPYLLHFWVLSAVLAAMFAMSSIWAWAIWLMGLCVVLLTYFSQRNQAHIRTHLFELIKIQIWATLALLVFSRLSVLVLWGMGVATGWNGLSTEAFDTKWFYFLKLLTGLAYMGVGIWAIWRLCKNIRSRNLI